MDDKAPTTLSLAIDAIGILRAQMAELEEKEDALREAFDDLKPGGYEGQLFRLTISIAERKNLDMKAVRKKLTRQWIAAHTKKTTVRSMTIAARSGINITAVE